jgi:tetratricopeptide (TPR) repeat protein
MTLAMTRKGAISVGAIGAAALVALALVSKSAIKYPPIPDPTTDAMEPQVAEKVASARKAVAEDKASDEAWGHLGMVFHAHYLESEAAPCYSEAHRLDPDDFRWPYLLTRILKSQDPGRALEVLDEARRLKPDFAPLHLLAAELLETRGDFDSAIESYRRALSVDHGSAGAEFGIGRLLLAKADLEESATHLERAAVLDPEAGSIQATLSQLYHRLGREEEATEAARRARRLHPDLDVHDPVLASVMEEAVSLVGYQARAVDAERAGDPLHAEALLRHAIEIRPLDASLHYNLANHLSRQGRLREAEESYRQALKLDAGHAATLVNLGILVAQNGKLGEARQLFEKAIEREPAHAGALLGLGNVAAAEGRLDEAVRLFERALESDPDRPDSHYALARALAARGASDDAVEHFLAALEGAPERADIHVELAELYARRHDNEAAERHIFLARGMGMEPPDGLLRALSKHPEQKYKIPN